MDPDISIPLFVLFAGLLAANAFCAAAEFTLIAVRRGRLEQQARDGDHRAARVLSLLARAEELALVAQLGSSFATLGLGVLLASASWQYFSGVGWILNLGSWRLDLASPLAVIGGAGLAATIHAVIAAQVPKIVAIHRAEWLASRVIVQPLYGIAVILRPLTWALSRIIDGTVRLIGVPSAAFHPLAHTPEEIRMLVAQSHEEGVVEEDEHHMIHGVFAFGDTVAREVMTPRTDMVAVPADIELDDLLELITSEGHSRIPVYEGTPDAIVGVLLAKDLIPLLRHANGASAAGFDLRRIMREPYFVPDSKPVDDLLAEFRQHGLHLAIVLDEFGGTHGLVTMEDLLEEIVGEIHDEYDVEEPEFSVTPEGDVLIDGGALISEVNERFGLSLPENDFDTIGGYIFGALGRVPVMEDVVDLGEGDPPVGQLLVEGTEERRVTQVRLTRPPAAVKLLPEE